MPSEASVAASRAPRSTASAVRKQQARALVSPTCTCTGPRLSDSTGRGYNSQARVVPQRSLQREPGSLEKLGDLALLMGTGGMSASKVLPRAALMWLLQCAASGCWVASVLVYGNFETGDRLQLAAALAWCLGNVLAAADIFASDEPVAERTRTAQQDLGVAP